MNDQITLPKQDLLDMIEIGIHCFISDGKFSDDEIKPVINEILLDYLINKQ